MVPPQINFIFRDSSVKSKLEEFINNDSYIDFSSLTINPQGHLELSITPNPDFFKNKYDDDGNKIGIEFDPSLIQLSYKQSFTKYIKKKIEDLSIDILDTNQKLDYLPFPQDLDTFNQKYIDNSENKIKSKQDFTSKIVGKISFF